MQRSQKWHRRQKHNSSSSTPHSPPLPPYTHTHLEASPYTLDQPPHPRGGVGGATHLNVAGGPHLSVHAAHTAQHTRRTASPEQQAAARQAAAAAATLCQHQFAHCSCTTISRFSPSEQTTSPKPEAAAATRTAAPAGRTAAAAAAEARCQHRHLSTTSLLIAPAPQAASFN